MKHVAFIFAAMLMVACSGLTSNRFEIRGRVSGAEEGETICLNYPIKVGDIWKWQCDTTLIRSEQFCFEGNVDCLIPASLTFRNMDYANIYIEPTKITFQAERNSLADCSLQGLSIDRELANYRTMFGELEREIWNKHHSAQLKNKEWTEAYEQGAENCQRLWDEFMSYVNDYRATTVRWTPLAIEFVTKYPDYAITPSILEQLLGQGYNITPEREYDGAMGELLALRREICESSNTTVGSKALDFELKQAGGDKLRLTECYAKGYVLLDFWASWCAPCIGEIPKLVALNKELAGKLQIISLSVDQDKQQWLNAIEQHNLTEWPQLIVERAEDADDFYFKEQGDLSTAYNITQIPCFILISEQGRIVGRWEHLTNDTTDQIRTLIGK